MNLKKFDSTNFKCISRDPDPLGVGHLYQFSCIRYLYFRGADWPASQEHCENDPHSLKAGFRFWSDDHNLYAQIPCPKAINHRLGTSFDFYTSKETFSDLEYAELTCNHDFVISKNWNLYHDMVNHVRKPLSPRWQNNGKYDLHRPLYLKEAIAFYKQLNKPNPGLEFCFGVTADGGGPFVPTYFISLITATNAWNKLFSERYSGCTQVPDQMISLFPVMDVVCFWEIFKPHIAKTTLDGANVFIPTVAECSDMIIWEVERTRYEARRIREGNTTEADKDTIYY